MSIALFQIFGVDPILHYKFPTAGKKVALLRGFGGSVSFKTFAERHSAKTCKLSVSRGFPGQQFTACTVAPMKRYLHFLLCM